MDSSIYQAKLLNHPIFKDCKDSFSENPSGKLRNLIDIRDDVLYLWNAKENCLFTLNLKRLEETDEEASYQKLHLLSPPAYPVERVTTSSCSSRICVWGARGVTTAELPARWGRSGLFDGAAGGKAVLCKSYSLDERFLYSQAEVRKVLWHPNSLNHLLVLVSDNTIRLYNIALKSGPKLVKIITIGPKPSSLLAGRTILDSLGDTAVDFTATPDCESLLILRGNGDVYMMSSDFESKSPQPPKLSGPLAMYPPADDNYGTDSCAITTLGGRDTPALVVVATCSAALYHCLLLPTPSPDNKEEGDSHALYVVESVELNIALNGDEGDSLHSYPVHLHPCTSNSYACVHAAGVHAMTLPALKHLKDLVDADEAETETIISSISSSPCVARHLVRTVRSGGGEVRGGGVAICAPPLPALVVLCADGQPLIRTLEPYDLEEQLYKEIQLKNPALEQDDINKILKEAKRKVEASAYDYGSKSEDIIQHKRQKLSFTSIIQEILSREVSQPILKLDKKDEPSPKEMLEFLTQATLKLRGEYVSRQQRALDAIARKVTALKSLAKQHETWFTDLETDIDDAQLTSSVLKDKCVLAEKHQDDLKYRCSSVIRSLRSSSSASPAELALLAELEQHAATRDTLQQQIHNIKQYAANKTDELLKWESEYKKKDIALGKSHGDTISSILQQQTGQISTLIEDTKLLKDQLSIV